MNLIQFILIGSFLVTLICYLLFWRSAVLDRLIAVVLFVVACFAVVFPAFTGWCAEVLGVGRGTDLLLYLFFAAAVYFGVLFYSKIMRLDGRVTELVRHVAILEATPPIEDPSTRHASSRDKPPAETSKSE